MGRKPNPLILEYFERGPKLNDNSNRYPHTCKLCGEIFPKGRIDSLTAHITKRCPAISESERMRACLELHGIAHARTAAERHQQVVGRESASAAPSSSTLPQEWSALETLAEASRQVDLNENSRSPNSHNAHNPSTANSAQSDYRFDVQGHYTLDNPPVTYDMNTHDSQQTEEAAPDAEPAVAPAPTPPPPADLTPEERLQALLPVSDDSPDNPNISVAFAAAARLNSAFFDPQLISHDHSSASPPPSEAPAVSHEAPEDLHAAPEATQTASPTPIGDTGVSQPWGEMTYLTTTSPAPAVHNNPPPPAPLPQIRGGVRMDTSGPMFNGRSRHFRSKFTPARRQEVKEVRKLGACIRCRILRKICSKGTPCDTCRKVLAPRVWMTGCVRSRLHEQLDLYSAGVQVVLSQNRINLHKDQLQLTDVDSVVEVSHFPDTGRHISLPTLAVLLEPGESPEADAENKVYQVIMINQDKEDVPGKVDAYVRDVLELFVEREPSRFMRVTLETAMQQLAEGEDELLRKALELWGLVESIDRERQWTIVERPAGEGQKPRSIKEAQDENDVDIYTMICMQLNAAAERKANGTSKALLNLMDRLLADSKTKAGFRIYLTSLILLNCVEKSTWAFKAWEQDHLRPGWPLERDPGAFTQQGGHLAALFKMLLSIRRALPQTMRADDGKLATLDPDPVIVNYFQSLDMEYDTIQTRQRGSEFSPADSRSLELMFCSHLLLPNVAS
ncbi:putative zn 2cys6 transcription factor protein [Hirsutella rhossiliensis]|uniref:Zn 2cys6 transcription factor protein n=1 Tax=Hirsutella rhossiliensis TaxID=111463 RepID=A0A9P8SKQ6_9HYPO|nr:putative zn 2cys6 transcription factor protein [Hirsutella rhossiliensis]KAH0965479.1 putative zn 2cys6 transcription factor protein [Hirsutella rhossiliensis]